MARFEVFIPANDPEGMNLTLRVTADTWMAALKVGLKKIGETGSLASNVLCDIQDDESIHVTDSRTNRVFRIVQIAEVSDPGKVAPAAAAPWMASPAEPDRRLQATLGEQEARARQIQREREQAEQAARERALAEARAQEEAKAAAEQSQKAERAAAEARAQAERAAAEARAAAEERERHERTARQKAEAETKASERAKRDREAAERAAQEAKARADAQENALRAARAAAEEKLRADAAAREKVEAEVNARKQAVQERAAAEERRSADRARSDTPQETVRVVQAAEPKNRPPSHIGRDEDRTDHGAIEEVLCDLFDRTPAAFDKKPEDALYFLLDLALEKIPSDSGSVYVADLNRRDLRFAAVRGPKAKELLALGLRVPMGKGFVGFCAQEGVAIAISDAQRDPRFYKEISGRLGYETRSVLTTPVLQGGRALGAIQLINKKGSSSYTQGELAVLHYLAHQAALYLELHEP